jgi:hypothetical protein
LAAGKKPRIERWIALGREAVGDLLTGGKGRWDKKGKLDLLPENG